MFLQSVWERPIVISYPLAAGPKHKGIWIEDVAEAMKAEFENRTVRHGNTVSVYASDEMRTLAGLG